MPLTDPYSWLAVPKELVVDFLGAFARCEFAMKETTYRRDARGIAAAAWEWLAEDAAAWLRVDAGGELEAAIDALTSTLQPRVQTYPAGWRPAPLPGGGRVAQAVNAAVRVRNNLFHGGKHTPEAS